MAHTENCLEDQLKVFHAEEDHDELLLEILKMTKFRIEELERLVPTFASFHYRQKREQLTAELREFSEAVTQLMTDKETVWIGLKPKHWGAIASDLRHYAEIASTGSAPKVRTSRANELALAIGGAISRGIEKEKPK